MRRFPLYRATSPQDVEPAPGHKERRLPQLLADADLKRFFRAIQDCGDVQQEILLKLLFYTAVRVSELVHIEVGDVDLDACKIRRTGMRPREWGSKKISVGLYVPLLG